MDQGYAGTVFITKWRIVKKVFDGSDASRGQEFGSCRTYTFQVHHFRSGREG